MPKMNMGPSSRTRPVATPGGPRSKPMGQVAPRVGSAPGVKSPSVTRTPGMSAEAYKKASVAATAARPPAPPRPKTTGPMDMPSRPAMGGPKPMGAMKKPGYKKGGSVGCKTY